MQRSSGGCGKQGWGGGPVLGARQGAEEPHPGPGHLSTGPSAGILPPPSVSPGSSVPSHQCPRPAPAAALLPLVTYSSVCSQDTVTPRYKACPTVFVTPCPGRRCSGSVYRLLLALDQSWCPMPQGRTEGREGTRQDSPLESICSLGLRNRRAGPWFRAVFLNSSPLGLSDHRTAG